MSPLTDSVRKMTTVLEGAFRGYRMSEGDGIRGAFRGHRKSEGDGIRGAFRGHRMSEGDGIRGYSISRTRMSKYVLGIRFFPNYAWAAWSNPTKNCYLVFWV